VPALSKKIRPDLRFRDDNQHRVDSGQGAANTAWKIEGEIKDMIGKPGGFPRQLLTCRSNCGEHHGMARILKSQAFHEFPDCPDLSNRYGVNPYASLQIGNIQIPKPGFQGGKVMARTDEVPGCGNQ